MNQTDKKNNEYIQFIKSLDARFPLFFDEYYKTKPFQYEWGSISEGVLNPFLETLVSINANEAKRITISEIEMMLKIAEVLSNVFTRFYYEPYYEINHNYLDSMHSLKDILEAFKPIENSLCYVKKKNVQIEPSYKLYVKKKMQYESCVDDPWDVLTEEQKSDFDICSHLYESLSAERNSRQDQVIEILLDPINTVAIKKQALSEYMSYRTDLDAQKAVINGREYSATELIGIAEKLSNDDFFYFADADVILESLNFKNYITFTDEVITYHNYRLVANDESLMWMVHFLTLFVSERLNFEKYLPKEGEQLRKVQMKVDLTLNQSIELLKSLIAAVSIYWNKYCQYFEEDNLLELKDDYLASVNERIDVDADNEFGREKVTIPLKAYLFLWQVIHNNVKTVVEKNDCKTKIAEINKLISIQEKKYDARYVLVNISKCSKSIYLLSSVVETIEDNHKINFSEEQSILLRMKDHICNYLYRKSKNAYSVLNKDSRINSANLKLHELEAEKDRDIRVLKYTIEEFISSLDNKNVEDILSRRGELIKNVWCMAGDSEDIKEYVDEQSMRFTDKLQQLITNNESDSLEEYRSRIKKELKDKYELLPDNAKGTLATAEYLYHRFVLGVHPAHFDFSGISVLYFQAFEATYNHLLIKPYANYLRGLDISDNFESCKNKNLGRKKMKNLSQNDIRIVNEVAEYYEPKNIANIYGKDKTTQVNHYLESMEMGKFKYLIKWTKNCVSSQDTVNEGKEYIKFLKSKKCFGKSVLYKDIDVLYLDLEKATDHRNDASHGIFPIDLNTAEEDKGIIYDDSNIRDIQKYKNLLIKFLDLFDTND